MSGLRWKYLLTIVGILVVTLPIGYYLLKPYQKDRLVSFIYPDRDPKGTGFQVIQSRIAVGNGGMWGRGAKDSSQTHLGFLPVPHTDFIFSSFAEEHGFVGIVIALVLYFLLIMQIVQNAQTATDRAGLYVCMGVAALLLFHVLVNVGSGGTDVCTGIVQGNPLLPVYAGEMSGRCLAVDTAAFDAEGRPCWDW